MSESLLEQAAELVKARTPCALVTVIRTSGSVPRREGAKMLVGADGALLAGTIGGGLMESQALALAAKAVADGKPVNTQIKLIDPASGDAGVCGGTVELFIDPLITTPTLLIAGAGHVGRALVHLGRWSGMRTVLIDDRPDLCNPDAVPGADAYLALPLAEALAQLPLTPRTFAALVTRGFPIDVTALPSLLRSPVAYIGVIGSQRRWVMAQQSLRELGVSDADLKRVHAPIGLEIHAETPEEIAVSIMAQVIGVLRES